MRVRPLILFLVCALWACVPAPRQPTGSATLRVMTLNIFAGHDAARQPSLDRVGAFIDSIGPDVVFLQEVDRLTRRSGIIDQAATLAERTGMHVVFGASMQFDGGEFGNALLTRAPPVQQHVFRYEPVSDQAQAEPRSLVHATLSITGRTVHVLSTHLDHRADTTSRYAQMAQLLEYIGTAIPPDQSLVVGADLNARPADAGVSRLLSVLDDAWVLCGSGAGFTFRADALDRRIDYVLLRRATCTRVDVPDTQLSDHRPVVADIVLPQ